MAFSDPPIVRRMAAIMQYENVSLESFLNRIEIDKQTSDYVARPTAH